MRKAQRKMKISTVENRREQARQPERARASN
jgi:hypothetical protein